MKTSLATTLSIVGVLATGGLAMAVNTTVLDSTVSSVEGSPALAEANVSVSALSVTSTVPSEPVSPASETTLAPTSVQSAYDVEGAGIVTLEQNASVLTVLSVNPVSGWTYNSTVERTNRVEVEFTDGTQDVKFTAELLDGRIITAVEATDTKVSAPRKDDGEKEDDHESGGEIDDD